MSEATAILHSSFMTPLSPVLWLFIAAVLASYLLGSVPFGLLASRCKGMDIRSMGSGNIGATNVFRSMGTSWGVAVFTLDFTKGLIPAAFFPLWFLPGMDYPPRITGMILGCVALFGHNWPVFLRFRGGKGVATSAGMLTGSVPMAMLAGIITWALVFLFSRYVSLASMAGALAAGGSAWFFYRGQSIIPIVLSVISLVIIWQHRSNIGRLLKGAEQRFYFRSRNGSS